LNSRARPTRTFSIFLTSLVWGGLLIACGEKQDHLITSPDHPQYVMFGTVSDDSTGDPYTEVQVDIIMTELYQGSFLMPKQTFTDSVGYYEMAGLYRARYTVMVQDTSDTLWIGEAGIIKYEDKQFNILITADTSAVPPDTTLK